MKSLKWFKSRIGKRIYRDPATCKCLTCQDVETNGIVVGDATHAIYLWQSEADFLAEGFRLNYRDEK